MTQVIYETSGRAREYNELAINLYSGCGHKCSYCYGADVTHQDKARFENNPMPRVTADDIERSARNYQRMGEKRRVLLCFVTDPYQPLDEETQLTRHAIEILHKYGLGVIILTKGGNRSLRDFDLLKPNIDAYATTLTLLDPNESLKWEAGAALPNERMSCLEQAHKQGLETWVSLEPVIKPDASKDLMLITRKWVNHFKVGTLNYDPHAKDINWANYGWEMKRLMDTNGVRYYFKKDLLAAMKLMPYQFKQTWVCG